MDRWVGRVVLVTGASVGIGAGLVKCLVAEGMKVIGCARNVEKIQKLGEELKDMKGTLTCIKCDLRKEEDILNMFNRIKNDVDLGGVDVCINNAGLSHDAPLLSGATEDWRDILDVNLMAAAICSREAFKSMQERGIDDGHLIFTNSLSGHRVLSSSKLHFYAVSKYGLTALIEGTRQEIRELKLHIRVTAISPGVVETEFSARMNKSEEKAKYMYSQLKCLNPKDISDAVLYSLKAPPHVEINDIIIRPTEQTS